MSGIQGLGGATNKTQADKLADQGTAGNFNLADPKADGAGDMQYYLQIMQQMQAESRAFTTYSNILTTRHNAAMNAARNIR